MDPNEKCLTDISEFQISAGKVHLSPMIDCFDGLVVSWTIGTRPDSDLVNTMLDAAIEAVASSKQACHSCRSWGSLSLARLAETGAQRRANPLDVMQGLFARQCGL